MHLGIGALFELNWDASAENDVNITVQLQACIWCKNSWTISSFESSSILRFPAD